MNGIDISRHNKGINIAAVPCDFVIVKATQGDWYTSEEFRTQIQQAANADKFLGVYHYIDGTGSAKAEMNRFYNVIKDWIGKVIICLDWEPMQNSKWGDTSYLRQCIEKIKSLTGKAIFIYASKSAFPWSLSEETGCRSWVAQYANDNATGYQANPWNESAYKCDIRQYSSTGRLTGYSGNLDINKAYITREEWTQLAGGTYTPSTPSTSNGYNIYLQSRTATKVLPKVINGEDNAGINAPMTYLSAWTEPGTLKVQARTEKGGWLSALNNPSNISDRNTGAVGDGSPITGIRMYYDSPNGDKAVHYRVKTEKSGWLPWMIDHKDTGRSKDDFAGDGSRIQRVEAYIGGLS